MIATAEQFFEGFARSGRDAARSASIFMALCLPVGLFGCSEPMPQEEMTIQGERVPEEVLAAAAARQVQGRNELEALRASQTAHPAPRRSGDTKQILFGDLHVHTTFSFDAYLFSLPAMGGDGAHPPADACDFARYCANLDFFALTDHAESLREDHWNLSKQSIRDCNARAGDPSNPDLVAFMGYEWSQAGLVPEEHFGHRCLVFPETDDAALPLRPVAAADRRQGYLASAKKLTQIKWTDPLNWSRYTDYVRYAEALAETAICDESAAAESGDYCIDVAPTPRELHAKLDEWGGEVLEIPHGTAWGVYTPATTTIEKHLAPEFYDAERMKLIEIMSGHGNSEEYRAWREWEVDGDGNAVCPAPTADYLPCCWQAGEIMRSRCDGLDPDECERRVELAKTFAMQAYTKPIAVFPDAAPEEWLDCGQCRDCFKPSFSYRPRESVQYAMSMLAEAGSDSGDGPAAGRREERRFRYGFVASSDEHSGRPGVGYKNVNRGLMTDVNQVPKGVAVAILSGGGMADPQMPLSPKGQAIGLSGNDGRTQAFLYPGGLAAVHAASRRREDVWDAMQRREVYATSGPRILLWFDLVNGPGEEFVAMGGQVELDTAPQFEVRALGSFEPKPGCPDWSAQGLGADRMRSLCQGECYFPSDRRRPIVEIEVVRITPGLLEGGTVEPQIEDPWRRYSCEPAEEGCVVRFSDPEFLERGKDVLYYVRALEEARPAILGNPLRPQRDASGRVVSVSVCDTGDDCLDDAQERAWSSPIFVDYARVR